MPTYEGYCKKCDEAFDYSSEIKFRDVVPVCPHCRGAAARVILTAPRVQPDANDFSKENNGRGRYNAQLRTHIRSVSDGEEKGRRKGWGMTRG